MRVLAAAAAVLFATLTLLPARARAGGTESSIRCTRGVVSLGDATIDLLGKCGAPTLREVRAYDGAIATLRPTRGAVNASVSERWTYDFGPQQFAMFVTVEGGKVVGIERGNRGYVRTEEARLPVPRATCDVAAIKVGDAKLDLLARCGEPALMEMRKENLALASARDAQLLSRDAPRDVEVWTYDFGPQQLVRFAILADGVVVAVETGGHGYSEPPAQR